MGREWELPPVDDALDTAGLWPIKEYIQRRQATFVAQVACQPIYELCMGAEKIPVYIRFMMWWNPDERREVEGPGYYYSF